MSDEPKYHIKTISFDDLQLKLPMQSDVGTLTYLGFSPMYGYDGQLLYMASDVGSICEAMNKLIYRK